MTRIPKFDLEIHSEELFPFTEEEYSEVMATPVDDEWTSYSEWSAEIEQAEFEHSLEARAIAQTANGPMLLKRECSHEGCEFSRCKRGQRIEGIDV
jgi:hypothetical protein